MGTRGQKSLVRSPMLRIIVYSAMDKTMPCVYLSKQKDAHAVLSECRRLEDVMDDFLRLMAEFIGYFTGWFAFLPFAAVFLVASDRTPLAIVDLEKGGLNA